MEQVFLSEIDIKSVRHLHDISIPLDINRRKHLVLTGKNGSGKTSVLDKLAEHLQYIVSSNYLSLEECTDFYKYWKSKLEKAGDTEREREEKERGRKNFDMYASSLRNWQEGVISQCSSFMELRRRFEEGRFILAYYKAERSLRTESYTDIEKVDLKTHYDIDENPGSKFTKYLVNLRTTQALSAQKGRQKVKADRIETWFENLTEIVRDIYEDPALTIELDVDSFQFTIHAANREPFDFNTMSSGYGAVFDIVSDLIMRMEAQSKLRDSFDLEGIVLIDEIETHLHLELQKKILPVLTKLFPNIQFIVSTHSPFVLNSLNHVVIYDLEKRLLSAQGMGNLPYEGIVEGYFHVDRLSDELRQKFDRYRELVNKDQLSDEEYAEIDSLEYYLDEIPDYLASEIASEYSRLKLEFSNRE